MFLLRSRQTKLGLKHKLLLDLDVKEDSWSTLFIFWWCLGTLYPKEVNKQVDLWVCNNVLFCLSILCLLCGSQKRSINCTVTGVNRFCWIHLVCLWVFSAAGRYMWDWLKINHRAHVYCHEGTCEPMLVHCNMSWSTMELCRLEVFIGFGYKMCQSRHIILFVLVFPWCLLSVR